MAHIWLFASSMIIASALVVHAALAGAAERPCRADIEKFCASVERGGGRVAECLQKHYEEISPECKERGEELRERAREVHEACKEDVSKYCKEVKPGQGRIHACLEEHDKELSAGCKAAMKPAR